MIDATAIDALLPQTQCEQCGYPGCMPYAQAIAAGNAAINQCPPGGAAVIQSLANLLKQEAIVLNPKNGVEKPLAIAWIDENTCIGCTKCIQACPVDAIIGSGKRMHSILVDACTGCELCIAPCPVDCIYLTTLSASPPPQVPSSIAQLITQAYAELSQAHVQMQKRNRYRQRHLARKQRLQERKAKQHPGLGNTPITNGTTETMPDMIQQAILRAQAKKQLKNATKND